MNKKLVALTLAAAMAGTIGCMTASAEEAEGYTYGVDVTFHSDEPVTYTMMFSDHENYPLQDG